MNNQNKEGPENKGLSDVLGEQDQEQPKSQAEPADDVHKCSICGSPDYRACGCEARAEKESQPIPPNEKINQALSEAEPQGFQEAVKAASNFGAQLQAVVDTLIAIDSGIRDLIELEKQRRDLLKDVQNGSQN